MTDRHTHKGKLHNPLGGGNHVIKVPQLCNWAFTRYDRRTDWSARLRLRLTGRSDHSDRPVGQTVAEPPTPVNQINVAC